MEAGEGEPLLDARHLLRRLRYERRDALDRRARRVREQSCLGLHALRAPAEQVLDATAARFRTLYRQGRHRPGQERDAGEDRNQGQRDGHVHDGSPQYSTLTILRMIDVPITCSATPPNISWCPSGSPKRVVRW